MTVPPASWYVVHTHSYAETRAAEHLRRQGFEVYLPMVLKIRRHARRTETVVRPFFPRYLFVAIDMAAQRWHCIRSTIGVSQLVGNEAGPVAVPERILRELWQRENSKGFIPLDFGPHFVRGDRVQLVDGAFASCNGLFEEIADHDRVAILLEMLGRRVRVVIDSAAIAPA